MELKTINRYYNGKLKFTWTVNSKGKIHGTRYRFYEDGEIYYKRSYINGRRHGVQYRYQYGDIIHTQYYIHGVKTTKYKLDNHEEIYGKIK